MTLFVIQYLWLAILLAVVVSSIAGGGADGLLARWLRSRWRKRYRRDPAADPIQAMLDEHAALMTPNAGVALAIVTPQGVRHAFAGCVDGKGSPVPDADTVFEIGSISKTFTAALLIAMVDQGQVSLDTPLDHLLPADNRLGRQLPVPVTLESLATHCSGLPRIPWGWPQLLGMYATPQQPYRFMSESVMLRWLRHRKINYGQRYRYSNLGYGVLGSVLAQRAGLDYATALRRFVLHPLGLAHTDVGDDSKVAPPHTSLGRRVPVWNLRALTPAGGIHGTLADMTCWLQANMAETAPLDARLHTARANSGGKHRSIALAWHVDGDGDRRVVWHNGQTGGSSSVIAFAPARGTGVVVLSNAAASVDELGLRILHYINTPNGDQGAGPTIPGRLQTIAEGG